MIPLYYFFKIAYDVNIITQNFKQYNHGINIIDVLNSQEKFDISPKESEGWFSK